jgi:hypothetical protein
VTGRRSLDRHTRLVSNPRQRVAGRERKTLTGRWPWEHQCVRSFFGGDETHRGCVKCDMTYGDVSRVRMQCLAVR